MAALNVSLLGPPRVEVDGVPISVDTRKATALLAYLATTEQRHGRDTLADLLWPDHDRVHGRGALRRTLSVLNRALGGRWLEIDRSSVGLELTEAGVDVRRFRALARPWGGHAHGPDQLCDDCVRLLAEACDLYRGDFLSGFGVRDSAEFDDWQTFEAESLRRELAAVLERLVAAERDRGDLSRALEHARRWLALDPIQEPAHQQLMTLHALAGQSSAAVRQYRECVAMLERELGVPPLAETTRLYEAIVRGRAPVRPRAAAGTEPASRPQPLLVGRGAELVALTNAYEAIAGDGRVGVIEGEAGIGKSRLARAFCERVALAGAGVLSLRCFEEEIGLAFGPVMDGLRALLADGRAERAARAVSAHWLAEAARLVPELDPAGRPPPPLDGPGAQSRFFEGLARVISAACADDRPGVLFVDDVHWADGATLDLLSYLVRRLTGRRLLVVLTRRPDPDYDARLGPLDDAVRTDPSAVLLHLERLGRADLERLLRDAADSVDAARVEQETEGLPLLVVEYLDALAAHEGDGAPRVGAGARALFEPRVRAVGETARQVLAAAAVIGRSFDFDALRHASGRTDEEVVSALEELVRRGLVTEVRDPVARGVAYDFVHEQVRRYVVDRTSRARLRLLHGRVADALVRRAAAAGEGAGAVAEHLRRAGRDGEAAEFYERAGRRAASLYANAEALAHYREALALDHPAPGRIHEAMGDLLVLVGDYEGALESFEGAAALNRSDRLATLEGKIGGVYQRRGDWELAAGHLRAALDAAPRDDASLRTDLLVDLSFNAHRRGAPDAADALARDAVALAENAGDLARARALNLAGILAAWRGDLDAARKHLEGSLVLAEEESAGEARVAALNNLALVARRAGDLANATALARRALEECAERGDRHREAAIHNNLADLMHDQGLADDAMRHLKHAVAIFAEIGAGDEPRPEIWKLVEW